MMAAPKVKSSAKNFFGIKPTHIFCPYCCGIQALKISHDLDAHDYGYDGVNLVCEECQEVIAAMFSREASECH